MELVQVTWLDAQDHKDTWVDTADAEAFGEKECKIVSVGFVIKRGRKYLLLGSDWDEADEDWGTVRKVPLGMIIEIQTLIVQKEGAI